MITGTRRENINGFRNRLIVMLNWAWSYVTIERGATPP